MFTLDSHRALEPRSDSCFPSSGSNNAEGSWRMRTCKLLMMLMVTAACRDEQQPPLGPSRINADSSAASRAITDATRESIGGLPGFSFLRPIAVPDPSTWGTFDGSLVDLLAVEICEVRAGACVSPPLRRITAADPLPAQLRVVEAEGVYRAEWTTRESGDPSRDYRLRIVSASQELGYADLQLVRRDKPDTSRCQSCVTVVMGSTLSIVFRIDQGLGVRVGPAGAKVTLAGGNVGLDVPAGAVSSDVLFTAVPATNLPVGGPATVPGTAWDFGPNGIAFAKPVTLTIKYDPTRIPPGLQESELRIHKLVNGAYVQQNAGSVDLTTHTASALLNGFSIFVLLQRQFPGSQQDVQGAAISLVEFLNPNTNTYSPAATINTSGANVTLTSRVSITDDISGAEYIDVRFRSPSGRQVRFTCFPYPFVPPASGSDTNGQWACSSTWERYSESGVWQVQIIYLRDKALNWSYFQPGNAGVCDNFEQGTRCLTTVPQISVVSTPSDVTPAHVSAFEVSLDAQPRNYGMTVSVDASVASRPLVFRFHVTDALSGAGATPHELFYLRLDGPSGQILQTFSCTLVQGTSADGFWECPLTIPQSAEPGTWIVRSAVVVDRVGNNGYYTGRGYHHSGAQFCDADGNCVTPPTVTVTSAGDAEAPMLQSVAISATNADVNTTLDISDNLTGTATAWVFYFSATSNQYQQCLAIRAAGTATNGTYACQITFSQFAARGLWALQLQLWDAAGNQRTYTRRAADGYMCYTPPGGGASVCQNFGTTDLVLQ